MQPSAELRDNTDKPSPGNETITGETVRGERCELPPTFAHTPSPVDREPVATCEPFAWLREALDKSDTLIAMKKDVAERWISSFGEAHVTPVYIATPQDPALLGVDEVMKESGGGWRPCSGCYDTEDGHPTQRYPFSKALRCDVGGGCHECGGLGATWEHWTEEDLASFEAIAEEADAEHDLKMRVARLEAGVRRFRRAYVNLMEIGRDRIMSLGGSCDPVDIMEAGDPELRLLDEVLEGKH